jgi:ribosomal protein S18 acetylase RimI-like enzyme
MSIKYSFLSARDYVEAREVFRTAFAYSEWASLYSAWRKRASYGCYVARHHGVLVGFSLVSTDNVIKYIAVDPDYQGYKIGSSLVTLILGSMGSARSIRLTTAGDERLVAWYGRFGFRASEILWTEDGEFIGAHMIRRQRCRSAARV